jgi:uncharacterized protein YjbI with pentapeptide repeats
MDQLTLRTTTVDLPPHPDQDRDPVDNLSSGIGVIDGFDYADAQLRSLDLNDLKLLDGRVRSLRAESATWTSLRIDSVEFIGCDISSLRLTDSKLSRVRFTNCKMLGAALEEVTAEHVVFDHCKLDYATLTGLRAKGPMIFTGTVLREAQFSRCDLDAVLFDGCDLALTEFDLGSYKGCDLRGNELSTVRGVTNLRGVRLERAQTFQLAEALIADLAFNLDGDDHS